MSFKHLAQAIRINAHLQTLRFICW